MYVHVENVLKESNNLSKPNDNIIEDIYDGSLFPLSTVGQIYNYHHQEQDTFNEKIEKCSLIELFSASREQDFSGIIAFGNQEQILNLRQKMISDLKEQTIALKDTVRDNIFFSYWTNNQEALLISNENINLDFEYSPDMLIVPLINDNENFNPFNQLLEDFAHKVEQRKFSSTQEAFLNFEMLEFLNERVCSIREVPVFNNIKISNDLRDRYIKATDKVFANTIDVIAAPTSRTMRM